MEMQMNCFQPNLILLPAWDYLQMLKYLEVIYCSCPSTQDSLKSANHYGSIGNKGAQQLGTTRSANGIKAYEREKDSE